jgi:catechol 2,3-dioxygenase-like lactoylglutathione lyase family enzyme
MATTTITAGYTGQSLEQIQTTGVHHITLIGSNRQDTIDFYTGVLGMPLVFEQPNLDIPEEHHLFFDAGDGRLITFFVREDRATDPTPTPEAVGAVHHVAYAVSPEMFERAIVGLETAGYPNTGRINRGFMDSLYFRDPNGFQLELACYKFAPTGGRTVAEILRAAHEVRVRQGDGNITEKHLEQVLCLGDR